MLLRVGDKVQIHSAYVDLPWIHEAWRTAGVGTVIRFPTAEDILGYFMVYGSYPNAIVQFPGLPDRDTAIHSDMVELAVPRETYPLRFSRGDLIQTAHSFCPCERCDFTVGTITDIITSVGGASTEGDYAVTWDDGLTTADYDVELCPAGQRQEDVS